MENGSGELHVHLTRSEGAIITAVDDAIFDLLGLRPDELIGRPSTEWIHPDDQAGAVHAWMTMLATPDSAGTWVGRYRTGTGGWAWIETENRNRLDDPECPRIETTMRRASVDFVSIEEELRRREEIIIRLVETLPVGVFQVNDGGRLILTNDRLAHVIGRNDLATTDELMAVVDPDDSEVVRRAIGRVLCGEPVDDIEVRLITCIDRQERPGAQFCRFSLRALTDSEGNVDGAIGCVQDVTDTVILRQSLEMRASTDELTGCLNRGAIENLLRQVLMTPGNGKGGVAVAFVDLDDFKHINDTHGHQSGDQVLATAAERLRGAVRACDHVGRVGGDEFLVVCPDIESRALAASIGDRLAGALRDVVPSTPRGLTFRASVGIAWAPDPACSADRLIRYADEAMYTAKTGGCSPVLLVAS